MLVLLHLRTTPGAARVWQVKDLDSFRERRLLGGSKAPHGDNGSRHTLRTPLKPHSVAESRPEAEKGRASKAMAADQGHNVSTRPDRMATGRAFKGLRSLDHPTGPKGELVVQEIEILDPIQPSISCLHDIHIYIYHMYDVT